MFGVDFMSGAYLGSWKIDDLLTFSVVTHRVDTGALTDADAVPSFRVYEDETGTAIVTGSMAKLDDTNTTGFYSEQLTLSAANGYEKGKSYNIYITAAVNSVTSGTTRNFQIEAEVDANTVSPVVTANTTLIEGVDATNQIRDSLLTDATRFAGANIDASITSRLAPTVAGRTLDVTATGGAGIDWGNVESQGTTVNLSATTINLVNTATTVTNQLSAAAIATGVWQDAVAGDFTVASSIGKALYINNVAPGASGGHFIAGTNAATTVSGLTITRATASASLLIENTSTGVPLSIVANGVNANGVEILSGTTGGTGISITGGTFGMNIGTAASSGVGLQISGGTGAGLRLYADTAANAFKIQGGITVDDNITTDAFVGVVNALTVDTYAQPGQEAPAATQTLGMMIRYLYKMFRNRKTQTATQTSLYADDTTTVDQKATVSDDGVTADRGEWVSGP